MFIGLNRPMPACLATEHRLGDAIVRRCVPTVLAAIRGVPGVDLDQNTPSIFRFGAQNRDELTPACVAYASTEPGLRAGPVLQILTGAVWVWHAFRAPNHVGDLQILHHQKVEVPHQSAG